MLLIFSAPPIIGLAFYSKKQYGVKALTLIEPMTALVSYPGIGSPPKPGVSNSRVGMVRRGVPPHDYLFEIDAGNCLLFCAVSVSLR